MRIRELYLKNFGKFSGKKLTLSDGINLVYGENESGKSTIHTFIKSMLFGMERGRGRASQNDTFTSFEPWENSCYYSGAITISSGGKEFLLSRNFDKYSRSAELVCVNDGEELSIENGDLTMLLDNMTEQVFDNTVYIGQLKTEPSQTLAMALKNYATNYYDCGAGNLDLSAALLHLKKRKKDIEKDIDLELRKKQEKRSMLEQEASYIWREIHKLREEQFQLEDSIRMKKEEKTSEKENKRFLDEIRPPKWRIHPLELVVFLALAIAPFFLIGKPWNTLVALVIFLTCGNYVWNRMKISKKQEKTESEIILEEISGANETLEKMLWEYDHVKSELKEKEIAYDNLQEHLEELEEMSDYFYEQEEKRQAVVMAENKLNELSGQMQIQIRDRLNAKASVILKEITGGKYQRLMVEDNLKMMVFHEGRRINVEKLSRGTIEQIYFSLRMAAAELLHEEEQPVILDDTFVYYDDVRLEHMLRWISENKKQAIIFTCQKREEEMLEKQNLLYKKIQL